MSLLVLLLFVGAIILIIKGVSGSQQANRPLPAAQANPELAARRWAAVRRVAEEDVTQLGQQIAATPVPETIDPEAARDFDDALEAYERAKETLSVAQQPDDLQWVSRSLDNGRFALAKLDARREGRALPNRRPPCFFDQRHGLSVTDAAWTPAGGAPRDERGDGRALARTGGWCPCGGLRYHGRGGVAPQRAQRAPPERRTRGGAVAP